jgi:hypothetical protein
VVGEDCRLAGLVAFASLKGVDGLMMPGDDGGTATWLTSAVLVVAFEGSSIFSVPSSP